MGEGASFEKPSKMDDHEKSSKDVNSALIGNELIDLLLSTVFHQVVFHFGHD